MTTPTHHFSGPPPWEIGRPQPAFAALAEAGAITGRVLDVGCGTGEHTLLAAALGLPATGIDRDADALRRAEQEAAERGLAATFLEGDALRLADLGEVFDIVLDSLLFHTLDAADRLAYTAGLREVLRPGGRLFVLCYSDRHTGEPDVPHKVSLADIRSAFADGWTIDDIQVATSASNRHPGGVAAWLIACTRI